MSVKRIMSITVAVLMVSSVALGGAIASQSPILASSDESNTTAHAGTHVAFETSANAVHDYSVANTSIVDSVAVESASSAEQRGALGAGVTLSTTTAVEASSLSVSSESDTQVALESESGATIEAHDSQHGHLLVTAGEDGTLLAANVSADAEAEQEGDARVVVTNENGTQGTFLVIGEGEVTVNDEGNVTAQIGSESSLVYIQYDGERSDADEEREDLIVDGTAAAEVYVTMAAEGGSQAAADVVQFSQDTAVEVTTYSENQIEMTAERAESEGRVVITSISEEAFEHADDIEVQVDGEAAAHVETMNELEAAAAGGENSAYAVRSSSTAEATSEVLIAVNHFSERHVTLSSAAADTGAGDDSASDDASGADGADDSPTDDDSLPGFGVGLALAALLTSGLMAVRNRR